MPALVQSAFKDFPGPNGGARVIELKQQLRSNVESRHCAVECADAPSAPGKPPTGT